MSGPKIVPAEKADRPAAPGRRNDFTPAQAGSDIFFTAAKTTRMPMVVTDPHRDDNPIIFCNEAFSFMSATRRRYSVAIAGSRKVPKPIVTQ